MASIRIAHMADTHLGYRALTNTDPHSGRNQRTVDIEQAFIAAIDHLLTQDVDLVIHAGDLFHHARPAFPAIGTAIAQFRRLEEAGIPTYVIGGNHDTPRLRSSGSVFSLLGSALPGTHFAGGYEEEIVHVSNLDLSLTLIPHGRLSDPEPAMVFPNPGTCNILVTHGLVPTMSQMEVRREPGEELIGEALLSPEFEYIALGHFHQFHQPPGTHNAWYSGATERMGWGDRTNTPGYALVELSDSGDRPNVRHIELDVRPMVQIDVSDQLCAGNDPDKIGRHVVDKIAKLDDVNAMVRVVLTDVTRTTRRQSENLIKTEAGSLAWSIQVVARSDLFAGFRGSHEDLPSIDLVQQFERFVELHKASGEYDSAFADAFLETGKTELERAIEAANAIVTDEDAA